MQYQQAPPPQEKSHGCLYTWYVISFFFAKRQLIPSRPAAHRATSDFYRETGSNADNLARHLVSPRCAAAGSVVRLANAVSSV